MDVQTNLLTATGKSLINGQWIMPTGEALTKTNPVTGAVIYTGKQATQSDITQACQSASDAFVGWARRPLDERIGIIKKFASLLQTHKDTLASIISQETSKPLWETRTEVAAMIAKADISIQAYHERTGRQHKTDANGGSVNLYHRPHGVLAVFGPYNFPGHLPNGHIIPALIAGNVVVFKPSELTPWTAEATLKLWLQAGLPDGVINLVQGGHTTGKALANSKLIDGILFTGSANTGCLLAQQLAQYPQKILALEMGGNNALIIEDFGNKHANANNQKLQIDAAVNLAIQSAFLSAGQRCTCARRILVKQGEQGDAFIARFVEVSQNLQVGPYDQDPQPFMGGVISLSAAQNMLKAQQNLIDSGAKALLTMTQPDPKSSLLTPAILETTQVTNLPDEEYFGPLTTIYRYQSFDEAIKIANNTRYGLSCGLVSSDEELFQRMLVEIKAGIVNWNKPTTGASSAVPFGGVGASGNHRPSAYYAADYCAWPLASMQADGLVMPDTPAPGLNF